MVKAILVCGLFLVSAVKVMADERVDRLTAEVIARYAATRSITANITVTSTSDGKSVSASGTLRLLKPNKALVQLKGALESAVASDGKQMIHLRSKDRYTKEPVHDDGSGITFGASMQVPMFFNGSGIAFCI